jgi:PiT family inorganic phosphate transporter
MGVGLANALNQAGSHFGEGVNWLKAREVGLSLMISPLVGFFAAAGLLLLMKLLVRRAELYREPPKDVPPPLWIRAILVFTCTGVSFAHGSNDGQKGMGLILLILIGVLPGQYAINAGIDRATVQDIVTEAQSAQSILDRHATGADAADPVAELSKYLKVGGTLGPQTLAALAAESRQIGAVLAASPSIQSMDKGELGRLRSAIYLVSESITKLAAAGEFSDDRERAALTSFKLSLDHLTKYIPVWVKFAVAIALGLGTMIGWERIVITVGEKIGKTHLSYAQGASAEVVAALTIGAADIYGLPVSTTHVLSSGVAGTMAANHSGLQMNTLRNLLVAWVLTMPVCVFLGALLFSLGLNALIALGIR